MTAAIVARELGRRFGERVAVEGLSFRVEPGQVFGLLGPNGAGKTTTVRMLCALLTPSFGEGEVLGLALGRDGEAIRAAVGLLTEQPGLYDRLSARENLLYFARLYGLPEAVGRARVDGFLELFGLGARARDRVGSFSKGMRQKLALARAVLHDPKVVFLDEPTSGLDPEASAQVRRLIRELAGKGCAIVLCTHNLDDAQRLCDRVAVIKGRILAEGPVAELSEGRAVEIAVQGEAGPFAAQLRGLAAFSASTVECEGNLLRVALGAGAGVPELVAAVVNLGGRILSVRPAARELERVYLELVRRSGL